MSSQYRSSNQDGLDSRLITGAFSAPDTPAINAHIGIVSLLKNLLSLSELLLTCRTIYQTKEGGLHRIRRHLSEKLQARYLDGNWRIRIMKFSNSLLVVVDVG